MIPLDSFLGNNVFEEDALEYSKKLSTEGDPFTLSNEMCTFSASPM
jgi:hypothetical protein